MSLAKATDTPQDGPRVLQVAVATPPPVATTSARTGRSWRGHLTRRWSSSSTSSSSLPSRGTPTKRSYNGSRTNSSSSSSSSSCGSSSRSREEDVSGSRCLGQRLQCRHILMLALGALLVVAMFATTQFRLPAADEIATSMEPKYEAVRAPLEHKVQTRVKETLRRDPMATLAKHFLPDNIPGNAHRQIASSLDITLEKALRVKRRLQTQHSIFHEQKSALQAQAYLHEKLSCGPNITSERLARVRIVKDGGVGMSISQALFGINSAIGRSLVPILDQQELLWFSNAGMGIHDLFHLPCRPPAHILAQAESIDATSCDDVSCDRKKARNAVRIPPPFAHLPLMWWWRQLARSVVQPSPRVLAGMRSILHTAGFPYANPLKDPITFAPTLEDSPFGTLFDFKDAPRPLIAVHMRRGDSCTGGRPVCLSDAQSVHDLLVEKGLFNGTLLVASDSSVLLDELDDLVERNSHDSAGTRFRGQIASIHLNRTFYESFATKSSLRAKAYEDNKETKALVRSSGLALEALLDLALLAEGEIHVGSFFSNFIRGAMNLSGRNARSRYVSFDAQWCPFDICSLGWLTPDRCTRWHRHRCQWRPAYLCNSTAIRHCDTFAGTLCADQCTIFYQHKDAFRLSWIDSRALRELSPLLEDFVQATARDDDACCSKECIEETTALMERKRKFPFMSQMAAKVPGCETHQVWLRKLARLHSPESTWPNYDRTQGLTEELLRLPREDYYDVLSDFQADVAKIVVTTLRMHSGQ